MARKRKEEKKQTEPQQPDRYREAVAKCMAEFEVDRTAKQPYVEEMDEIDKLRTNKHWDLIGPNGRPIRTKAQQAKRPNAVENFVYALIDGMISDFAILPELVYFPNEADDEEAAQAVTDVVKHIMWKNRMQEEYEKWRTNFFWYGTGIWEHVWDPLWKGGKGPNRWVGDVRWRSVHPRAFFPDARCGESIHNGRRLHIARKVTLDYIKDKYPEWGSLVRPEAINSEFITSDESVLESSVQDEEEVLLVQTWIIGRPRILDEGEEDQGVGLHLITWAGEDQGVYLSHANYIYFEPGEDPRFPFTVRQFKLRDGSVWGYGAAYFVKEAQIVHNKNVELMVEGHAQNAFGHTYYNAGAISPKQADYLRQNGTLPGHYFEVNDINQIRKEYGASMPGTLQREVERGPRTIESILGRPDVSQGKNPGSVTAAAAIDLLQRRASARFVGPAEAIHSGFEESGDFIARLVWQNYTEARTYRIIDLNEAEDRFVLRRRGVFKADDYKKLWNVDTGMVVPLRDVPNPEELLATGEWELYEPELDVRCHTSTAMPTDRMVNIDLASKLLQTGAIDLQLFLEVIEKGRFPTWSEVRARYEQRQMMEMQQQAMQAAASQGQMRPQAVANPEELQALLATLTDEQLAQLQQLPPEEQARVLGLAG